MALKIVPIEKRQGRRTEKPKLIKKNGNINK